MSFYISNVSYTFSLQHKPNVTTSDDERVPMPRRQTRYDVRGAEDGARDGHALTARSSSHVREVCTQASVLPKAEGKHHVVCRSIRFCYKTEVSVKRGPSLACFVPIVVAID